MAVAAAAAPSGGRASNATATATATTTSRFAAACGALSQYIKAAEAERTRARPVVRPLPLMPGADVDDDDQEEPEAAAGPAHQLTIVYGGRALVLDDIPADKAADLLRLAAVAARGGTAEQPLSSATTDLPVARKASLQRFMAKRRGRVAARAEPYRRSGERRDDLTLAL